MGYFWLISEALSDTWGIVVKEPLITMIATVILFLISLYITTKRRGKNEVKKTLFTALEGLKIPIIIAVIILLLNLLFFTPKRLYEEQKTLRVNVLNLQVALKDRTHNIHPEDPAYWNLAKTIDAFSNLRRANADKGCRVTLTMPRTGNNSVAQIIFFGAGLADCPPTALDLSIDPEKEAVAMKGVESDTVIVHAIKGLKGGLKFSDTMGALFNVRRSYEPFPGMPQDVIWLQFGPDVQWNSLTQKIANS
jgi:hypothetical protein